MQQVRDYEDGLDAIMDNFKTHLKEDKENTLEEMIHEMKKHMCRQFGSMTTMDTKVVMGCIKDPRCSY